MFIEETNTRRFRHIDSNAVLAVYDSNRSYTLYGEVCADADGRTFIDIATVRTYFDDELEKLR